MIVDHMQVDHHIVVMHTKLLINVGRERGDTAHPRSKPADQGDAVARLRICWAQH